MLGFLVVFGSIGVGCIVMGLRPGPWEIDHLEIEVAPPRPRRQRTKRIQAAAQELTDFYASRTDRISLSELGEDATGLVSPAPQSREAGAV
jgi:hypothetical protein